MRFPDRLQGIFLVHEAKLSLFSLNGDLLFDLHAVIFDMVLVHGWLGFQAVFLSFLLNLDFLFVVKSPLPSFISSF